MRKQREHDSNAWMMWHNAILSGVSPKKFPKLSQFLHSAKKPVKSLNENAIMDWLKGYSREYKKQNASR